MSTLRVYLSHSIRGVKAADATQEDMDANCERIKLVAMTLRYELGANVEIYVPAENEEFVGIAWREKMLTEEQILDVDCKIIDARDMVICNVEEAKGDVLQGGRLTEVAHAQKCEKPVCVFDRCEEAVAFIKDYMAGHN